MSITADHQTLPLDRRNIAVDVRGTGTAWTQGGTTFSLSGTAATGSSITQTIVNSGTLARLVLTTGTTLGDIAISDGTNSITLAVKAIPGWPVKRWFPGM